MERSPSPAGSFSGSEYHSAPSSRPSTPPPPIIEDPVDIDAAQELKAEGNSHFQASRWNEGLVAYRSALGRLPARADKKGKGKEKDDEEEASSATTMEEPDELAKLRAIINANMAACHMKLGENKEAVDACTQALLDDPLYIKALQRRATANDRINSWSSLTSAQEDYNKLLELIIPSSSTQTQINEIKRALVRMKPRLETAQKAETAEMLGKLKGLGNSILGNFGLSTDNFKFEPNGQGGYSMKFEK